MTLYQMAVAEMKCRSCGYRWEYHGLSSASCFCPRCGEKNILGAHSREIKSRQGVPYGVQGYGYGFGGE